MKVFVYESDSSLGNFFQKHEFQIPFLSSSLLSFLEAGIVRNGVLLGNGYDIFLPSHWKHYLEDSPGFRYHSGDINNKLSEYQTEEYELVFIVSLFSLMLGDFFDEDISYLKQNPEKFFANRGVVGGYLKKGQHLPKPEEFTGFMNFVVLDEENYLRLNQDLVENLSIQSVGVEARVYGNPIILSNLVSNTSTICGPCFVGSGVRVQNSYISPGTVLVGNTQVIDSTIMSSFIFNSSVKSVHLEDSTLSEVIIEDVRLTKGTKLPSGSVIIGERKI